VYPWHRRFVSKQHTLRKKGKHFNGKADHQSKPKKRTGADVFDMVKDLKVIFEKGHVGQSVLQDVGGGHGEEASRRRAGGEGGKMVKSLHILCAAVLQDGHVRIHRTVYH
jgi:hypothetical protein